MNKTIISLVLFLSSAAVASAHAVVKPPEVGVGKFQTFTLGVPSEKAVATSEVRLVLPQGLNYVSPNVKPGWNIEIKKEGEGESTKVTEIRWTGGNIPAEQRDEFLFSAQVPSAETTLQWKVYQTYADKTTVAWDADPATPQPMKDGKADYSTVGPFSQTKIINDLKKPETTSSTDRLPLIVSVVALALSIISFVKKTQKS